MKKTEITTKTVTIHDVVEVSCDRCSRIIDDPMEEQEMLSMRFTGGYSSVFGDGVEVEIDLCQQCLKDLIGGFCRYIGDDDGDAT